MDLIPQGLPRVQAYLDDVLIVEDGESQNRNLMAVLQRFREHGIKLRAVSVVLASPQLHI